MNNRRNVKMAKGITGNQSNLVKKVKAAIERANENLGFVQCSAGNHTGVPCEGIYMDEQGFVCCGHNGACSVRCGLSAEDEKVVDKYEAMLLEDLCGRDNVIHYVEVKPTLPKFTEWKIFRVLFMLYILVTEKDSFKVCSEIAGLIIKDNEYPLHILLWIYDIDKGYIEE
jgi:hypothetical protein